MKQNWYAVGKAILILFLVMKIIVVLIYFDHFNFVFVTSHCIYMLQV